MRYTAFGRKSGLRVSEYALGTANFGTGWGAGAEPDEARRNFRPVRRGRRHLPRQRRQLPRSPRRPAHRRAVRARLDKVSAMPLGVPHEGIAGSLGHLQGGDASSVIAPVVPVA